MSVAVWAGSDGRSKGQHKVSILLQPAYSISFCVISFYLISIILSNLWVMCMQKTFRRWAFFMQAFLSED